MHQLTGKRFADFDATPRLPHFGDRPALIIHDRRDRETPGKKAHVLRRSGRARDWSVPKDWATTAWSTTLR
ncbi:hypothetical protein N8D55_18090 [Xanthomonas hortorum pv. pelargonii]|nr:hypothetical protein N8D55_18090 [Xanthomonas hortorum pv. pelargonii]